MKRHIAVVVVLLFVGAIRLAAAAWSVQPDPDDPLARLSGTWKPLPSLQDRMGGSSSQSLGEISFGLSATPKVEIPSAVEGVVAGRRVRESGTFRFGGHEALFLLSNHGTSSALIYYPAPTTGIMKAFELILFLAPADDSRKDLLFVGGKTLDEPFFVFERAEGARPSLSSETEQLVAKMIGNEARDFEEVDRLLETLVKRPDWQALLDREVEEVRRDPAGKQNNRLLLIGTILERHLDGCRLDVTPLLRALLGRRVENEQKAAWALSMAAKRPSLFAGIEREAMAALIVSLTSERGKIANPSFEALHLLTGEKTIERDPEQWARQFEKRFHESLDLAGAVYELLAFVRGVEVDGKTLYEVNGRRVADEAALAEGIEEFAKLAARLRVRPAVVLFVDRATLEKGFATIGESSAAVQTAMARAGLSGLMVTEAGDQFYPPYEKGFPRGE